MSEAEERGGAVLVLTTTADEASASRLARTLVEEGLAACVTRTAVRSVYRWEEGAAPAAGAKVCEEDEVLLLVKTAASRVVELEARILELHPYSCPEVIRIAPEHVEAGYLSWLISATTGRP
ncbi:MAG: divalent-cation tolerance protein CutA [Candidatus Binatia bacterium]